MNHKKNRVVIATGGEWGDDDHNAIAPDDFIIGVDGGTVELLRRDRLPDLIVGDFDTAPSATLQHLRAQGVPIEQLPREKDMTDTDYAVTKALAREPDEVLFLGAWGSRWDHTLANVYLLERTLRAGVHGIMQNSRNRMQLVSPGVITVEKAHYTYLSLLAWSKTVCGIHLEGFRYPLVDATLERGSLGISNEWQGDQGTISHKVGHLLIIQSRD